MEWKCITICCDLVSRDFFFCWRSPHVTTRDPFWPIDSSRSQSLHKLSRIAKAMSWNIEGNVFGYFMLNVEILELCVTGTIQGSFCYCEKKQQKVITWKLTIRDVFFPAWISHLQSREAGYWFGYSGLCKLTIPASTVVFPQISMDFIIPTKCGKKFNLIIWSRLKVSTFYSSFKIDECTNSAIHKAAGLTVPGHSMISTGTIPMEQRSVHWLTMGAAGRNGLWGAFWQPAFWERPVTKEPVALWIAL